MGMATFYICNQRRIILWLPHHQMRDEWVAYFLIDREEPGVGERGMELSLGLSADCPYGFSAEHLKKTLMSICHLLLLLLLLLQVIPQWVQ